MALPIEKLRRDHRVDGFDCGKEPLNRFAPQSRLADSAHTYLALSDDDAVGITRRPVVVSPVTMRPSGCARASPGTDRWGKSPAFMRGMAYIQAASVFVKSGLPVQFHLDNISSTWGAVK
jgi:hypothetical protein